MNQATVMVLLAVALSMGCTENDIEPASQEPALMMMPAMDDAAGADVLDQTFASESGEGQTSVRKSAPWSCQSARGEPTHGRTIARPEVACGSPRNGRLNRDLQGLVGELVGGCVGMPDGCHGVAFACNN